MKTTMWFKCMLYSILLLSFNAFALDSPISTTKDTSKVELKPENPVAGDDVAVKVILGINNNSCTPQYKTNIKSTLMTKSIPPIIIHNVEYVKLDMMYPAVIGYCLEVETPFGPTFTVPKAQEGTHRLVSDGKLLAEFKVGNSYAPKTGIKPIPEIPIAGDELVVWYIESYGSSSCPPTYIPTFVYKGMSKRKPPIYHYEIDFKKEESTNTICTDDLVPHGPKLKLGYAKHGTYSFTYKNQKVGEFYVDNISAEYPKAVIKPTRPTLGDQVSLQWILGQHHNGCVPIYHASHKVVAIRESYPPQIDIEVWYKTDTVIYKNCTQALTEHGPVFNFGKLTEGNYSIIHNKQMIASFDVLKDSGPLREDYPRFDVYPSVPAEGDSVTVSYIQGIHKNSCAPLFETKIEQIIVKESYPPIIEVTVSYIDLGIPQTFAPCAEVLTEYGPKWKLPKVQYGTYLFKTADSVIGKFFVEKESSTPDKRFTVFGKVVSLTEAGTFKPVAQCSVTAMVPQIATVSPEPEKLSVLFEKPQIQITDNGGWFKMDLPDIDVSKEIYMVAFKNDAIGYAFVQGDGVRYPQVNILLVNTNNFNKQLSKMLKKTIDEARENKTNVVMNILEPAKSSIALRSGSLVLNLNKKQPVTVSVFGLNGQNYGTVLNRQFNSGTSIIPLSSFNLAKGLYLFKITGITFSKSFKIMMDR